MSTPQKLKFFNIDLQCYTEITLQVQVQENQNLEYFLLNTKRYNDNQEHVTHFQIYGMTHHRAQ